MCETKTQLCVKPKNARSSLTDSLSGCISLGLHTFISSWLSPHWERTPLSSPPPATTRPGAQHPLLWSVGAVLCSPLGAAGREPQAVASLVQQIPPHPGPTNPPISEHRSSSSTNLFPFYGERCKTTLPQEHMNCTSLPLAPAFLALSCCSFRSGQVLGVAGGPTQHLLPKPLRWGDPIPKNVPKKVSFPYSTCLSSLLPLPSHPALLTSHQAEHSRGAELSVPSQTPADGKTGRACCDSSPELPTTPGHLHRGFPAQQDEGSHQLVPSGDATGARSRRGLCISLRKREINLGCWGSMP